MLLTLAPILTFWTAALGFHLLGWNSPDNMEHPRNLVTVWDTVVRMLQFDAFHILSTLPMEWGWFIPPEQVYGPDGIRWRYIVGGIFLMDTVQYWAHWLQHKVPFLYKHVHSTHHAMRYSWSLGTLYNSYAEVLLLTGPLMGVIFMWVARFTFVEFQIVSSLAIFWAVMDHTSAFDQVEWLGRKDFHQIHHSVYTDCNFQQPFMTFWDRWMGTDYDSVMRRKHPVTEPPVDPDDLPAGAFYDYRTPVCVCLLLGLVAHWMLEGTQRVDPP